METSQKNQLRHSFKSFRFIQPCLIRQIWVNFTGVEFLTVFKWNWKRKRRRSAFMPFINRRITKFHRRRSRALDVKEMC